MLQGEEFRIFTEFARLLDLFPVQTDNPVCVFLQTCALLRTIQKYKHKEGILAEFDPTVDWHSLAPEYPRVLPDIHDDHILPFVKSATRGLQVTLSRRPYPGKCP